MSLLKYHNGSFICFIYSTCAKISTIYYLPLKYDIASKIVYILVHRNDFLHEYSNGMLEPGCNHTFKNKDNWRETPIKTATECNRNKSDIAL